MTQPLTVLDAMEDPELFGPWFKDVTTWEAWFVFLKAMFALPMDANEQQIFMQCTGRSELPTAPAREGWLICGRRAGKSRIVATIALYLACFPDWTPYLAPGERGVIAIIAADRRQARIILGYISALLSNVPALAGLTDREITETIDLSNGVTIEIMTASYKTARGRTIIAMLGDEIAFWPGEDSANPDVEIIAAVRPGMATIPGSLLLCASSPYARRGALHNAYAAHYGKPGPVLVWKADTRTMNPSVPQAWIDEQYEADPASAAAEYGGEFRSDVEAFISRDIVDAVVVPGRYELPPLSGVRYMAHVDPSGGSADSFTLAIAHLDRMTNKAVLDAVRERRPPFSPEAVVQEYAELLKSYNIHKVMGDRYAGEWPRERFRLAGIQYELADKVTSDIYQALLPVLNSGRVELLDNDRLIKQLCALERRTARSGKDSISHPPGQQSHDDVACAVGGAVVQVGVVRAPIVISDAVLAWAKTPRRTQVMRGF